MRMDLSTKLGTVKPPERRFAFFPTAMSDGTVRFMRHYWAVREFAETVRGKGVWGVVAYACEQDAVDYYKAVTKGN